MTAPSEWHVNREGWPAGPWDDEPDYVLWRNDDGVLRLIVRNSMGGLCGYVGVGAGHPWHGRPYTHDVFDGVSVHGGLTYSDECAGAVCHDPEEGDPDDVWWVGFDCGHAWDVLPKMLAIFGHPASADSHYRDLAYVRGQVEALAAAAVIATGLDVAHAFNGLAITLDEEDDDG